MSHTKGKLSVKRIGSKLFIVDDKGFTVTKVRFSKKVEVYATELVHRWNSQPDLLDALKQISDIEDERYTHCGFDLEVNNIAKAAISKAKSRRSK